MSATFDVAVLGATGLVGEAAVRGLGERNFPLGQVYALADDESLGREVEFKDGEVPVLDAAQFDFTRVRIVLSCAGSALAARFAPLATQAGCVVIDSSERFRRDLDVPLVIPEVNPDALAGYRQRNLIAIPDPATIQMLVALKPLYDAVGIERIDACTFEPASAQGREAIEELARQTVELLNGRPIKPRPKSAQRAFNAIPASGEWDASGSTQAELSLLHETRRILTDPDISVNATVVRVPVFFGQSMALHVATRERISASQARALLESAPGVAVFDDPADRRYPTAVTEAANHDTVYVGRIREDMSRERGLNLWVVSDNIRKGAATNSVQIAEALVRDSL